MDGWLDRWAKASATPGSRRPAGDTAGSPGLSRRQLLKRAGVVAGAAWTVPLIQSAVAPAAAASGGGCTSACPPGSPCGTGVTCGPGLVCLGGVCTSSGKVWTGSTCQQDYQCWSNVCKGGKCKPAELKMPCRISADCMDNVNCSAQTQTCGGVGATCQNKNKCISEKCVNGVCQP